MNFIEVLVSNEIAIFNRRMKLSDIIVISSVVLSILYIYINIFIFQIESMYNLYNVVFVSLSIIILPSMIFNFVRRKYLNKILEIYPTFLRALAEATRSGLSLVSAFKTLSSSDFSYLTPFIKKLYYWLSWGIPFEKAFKKFTSKLREIKDVVRINYVLLESYRAGGDIPKILETLASDLEEIQELEKEKAARINQQIIILYMIFIIFAGILIIILKSLAPALIREVSATGFVQLGNIDLGYLKTISSLSLFSQAISISLIIGFGVAPEKGAIFKHLPILFILAGIINSIFILPPIVSFTVYTNPTYSTVGESITICGDFMVDGIGVSNTKVEIYINNERYTAYTDEGGHYKIEYIANNKGTFEVKAMVEYMGKKYIATTEFYVE